MFGCLDTEWSYMNKIHVITDSASDLVDYDKSQVTVLPMTVSFGEEEYLDGVTISHRAFYEKLIESDELPVTSLVSPAAFEEAYRKALEAADSVVVIRLSGKLDGTKQSAMRAATDYPGRVFVIDSENAATGEQILVLRALELVQQGMDVNELVDTLEREKKEIHIVALLDTLEYLKKGGRISAAAAFVGGVLSVKPVITIQDGEVKVLGKARGSRNGNNFLIKEIEKTSGVDFTRPFRVGYTGLTDAILQKYIEDSKALWEGHREELKIATVGATIGTHVGPNGIVVAFFAKEKK